MVTKINPIKSIEHSNSTDKGTPVFFLHFDFFIVYFPRFDGDVPHAPTYGGYIVTTEHSYLRLSALADYA